MKASEQGDARRTEEKTCREQCDPYYGEVIYERWALDFYCKIELIRPSVLQN